jgi:hypothetical protein
MLDTLADRRRHAYAVRGAGCKTVREYRSMQAKSRQSDVYVLGFCPFDEQTAVAGVESMQERGP